MPNKALDAHPLLPSNPARKAELAALSGVLEPLGKQVNIDTGFKYVFTTALHAVCLFPMLHMELF